MTALDWFQTAVRAMRKAVMFSMCSKMMDSRDVRACRGLQARPSIERKGEKRGTQKARTRNRLE